MGRLIFLTYFYLIASLIHIVLIGLRQLGCLYIKEYQLIMEFNKRNTSPNGGKFDLNIMSNLDLTIKSL